jgi:hypothetical protein
MSRMNSLFAVLVLSVTLGVGLTVVQAQNHRIGKGPWQNAKGVVVAQSVADLHSDKNLLGKQGSLTETAPTPTRGIRRTGRRAAARPISSAPAGRVSSTASRPTDARVDRTAARSH